VTVRASLLAACAIAAAAVPAHAQVVAETDVTVGASTETVDAAAAQARVFGATRSDVRFFVEGAWGLVSGPDSDAFGGAYPYDRRLRLMDAFVEKTSRPGGWLLGVRAGHYRTPFGISGRGDHAYSGFLRAPLIRYGDNWALSNTFFETGVSVIAGRPSLSVETSLGRPLDEGDERRRSGLDTVVRGQAFVHSVILGVSFIRTQPTGLVPAAGGPALFGGMDGRWSHDGLELRGEWISGRPFTGVATRGGYLDVMLHRPSMGPVSVVARVERLDYDAGPYSTFPRRETLGARVRLFTALSVELNALREPHGLAGGRSVAFDAGLTFSRRF